MLDSEILELYFARDERAVEETQKKYGAYLYTVSHNILENEEDAREAVNDTYLGAWNAIPPQRPCAFSAFLAKTARNIALKKLRADSAKRRGRGQSAAALEELGECIPSPAGIEAAIEERELARILDAFLRELPETEQRIFMRRYWFMEKTKDICRDYGFSEGKVKMMLLRTRKKLLQKLTKEGINI